jgi:hypothetical protein
MNTMANDAQPQSKPQHKIQGDHRMLPSNQRRRTQEVALEQKQFDKEQPKRARDTRSPTAPHPEGKKEMHTRRAHQVVGSQQPQREEAAKEKDNSKAQETRETNPYAQQLILTNRPWKQHMERQHRNAEYQTHHRTEDTHQQPQQYSVHTTVRPLQG